MRAGTDQVGLQHDNPALYFILQHASYAQQDGNLHLKLKLERSKCQNQLRTSRIVLSSQDTLHYIFVFYGFRSDRTTMRVNIQQERDPTVRQSKTTAAATAASWSLVCS